ncbi:MAG: ANTAR domain-containing protein [Ruminococcus sp.]|nr:ANTAR domain-containing protein [Ruminococcus sp.]
MNILIVSQSTESAELIAHLVRTETGLKSTIVSSGNIARRAVFSENPPEMVIIDTPLPDEFGHELAVTTVENTDADVILICRNAICEDISHRIADYDVTVIPSPINRENFFDLLENSSHYAESVSKESPSVLTKTEEIRLISSAKCTLMEYLKFTEPQAHRYIEKQAMNNRQTRREVAEKIIKTYKK